MCSICSDERFHGGNNHLDGGDDGCEKCCQGGGFGFELVDDDRDVVGDFLDFVVILAGHPIHNLPHAGHGVHQPGLKVLL